MRSIKPLGWGGCHLAENIMLSFSTFHILPYLNPLDLKLFLVILFLNLHFHEPEQQFFFHQDA